MAIVRQKTTVFNKPVGVVRSNVGAQQVGNAISQAASGIQRAAFQEASVLAEKKGMDFAKAIDSGDFKTTNPVTGETTSFVSPATAPSEFGTIAATAYQRVVDNRYENSINNELKIKAKEVALKYPFNPEAYKEVMSDYIANLSEGSIGKYKEFINETGQGWLASTELDIKKQVFEKSRIDAANSIGASLSNNTEDMYKFARAGSIFDEDSAEMAVFNKEIINHENGIKSSLIQEGATEIASDQMSKAIAAGSIEYLMSISSSKSQRDMMILSLRELKSGAPISILSSRRFTEKEIQSIKQINRFSGQLNPKDFNSLIGHSNSVSSTYDVVEANEDAVQVAMRIRSNALFETDSGKAKINVGNLASQGFSAKENIEESIRLAFSSASASYRDQIDTNLTRSIDDPKYTKDDFESDETELKKQYIRPFLISLAADGNIKELKAYIASGFPSDAKNLTDKQILGVAELKGSRFYDSSDGSDDKFMSEILGRTVNQHKLDAQKQTDIFNLDQKILGFKSNEFDGILKEIKDFVVDGTLSSVSANQKIASAYDFQFEGLLNQDILDGKLDSANLNQIAIQLETDGLFDGEQVKGSVQESVNNIINNVPKEFREPIINKIKRIKTALKEQETINTAAIKKTTTKQKISTGSGGDLNSTYDRNISQEIMDDLGVDLSKFNTYGQLDRQRILSIARKVPPQGLVDVLKRISSGQPVEGVDAYLDLFSALNSDPTLNGQFINRFGNILGDTQSFLEEVNELRKTLGADPERTTNSIATTLFDRLNRPESKLIGLSILNSTVDEENQAKSINKAASNFTLKIFDNPLVAKEFEPIAKFYALLGKDPDEIEKLINARFDQTYLKTEFVVDHRYLNLKDFRSKSSLEAVFPDDEDRKAFIGVIESQLPEGYSLFPEGNIFQTMQELGSAVGTEEEVTGLKRVFLAPNPRGSDTDYYAYFLDKNQELKPLFIMEDNVPVSWPMFNPNDKQYLSYLTDKNARLKIEEEMQLDKDQQTIDRIQARPGLRLEDILNIFK